MFVFRYDKTFEGLLTALFDAYVRKMFPERLLGFDEPAPMFIDGEHRVVTETAKADRVWQGLLRKMPRKACDMLMYAWLAEEAGCDELLLRYMRKVFDSPGQIVTDFTDTDMLKTKQVAEKVSRERQYLIMFIRFQRAADGTFFAPVAPRHNVLPLIAGHFSDRFADQKWLIYDTKRRYGYYYDLEKATEITLEGDIVLHEKLTDEQMAEDERFFQQLWKNYFNAMTIRERINPNLQRKNMPRRFWRYLTEKQ